MNYLRCKNLLFLIVAVELLQFVNITWSIGRIEQYMCPKEWNSSTMSCRREFNRANYCGGSSVCQFHDSQLAKNISLPTGNHRAFWLRYPGKFIPNNSSCGIANSKPLFKDCLVLMLDSSRAYEDCNTLRYYVCQRKLIAMPVGMQSLKMPDHQVSSSSSFWSENEPIAYEAKFARIGRKYILGTKTQGGWCSKHTIVHGAYLQIEFKRVVLLTGLETQGVKGRYCNHWTSHLIISYRRNTGLWINYTVSGKHGTIPANTNAEDIAKVNFPVPISATALRLYPMGSGTDCKKAAAKSCLRVEAYGFEITFPNAASKVREISDI